MRSAVFWFARIERPAAAAPAPATAPATMAPRMSLFSGVSDFFCNFLSDESLLFDFVELGFGAGFGVDV
jgi:hypothetical protein